MKRKIKVIDKVSGKTEEHEFEVRNLDHLEIQKRNRANVFRNRKAYTRKKKHKNKN